MTPNIRGAVLQYRKGKTAPVQEAASSSRGAWLDDPRNYRKNVGATFMVYRKKLAVKAQVLLKKVESRLEGFHGEPLRGQ